MSVLVSVKERLARVLELKRSPVIERALESETLFEPPAFARVPDILGRASEVVVVGMISATLAAPLAVPVAPTTMLDPPAMTLAATLPLAVPEKRVVLGIEMVGVFNPALAAPVPPPWAPTAGVVVEV